MSNGDRMIPAPGETTQVLLPDFIFFEGPSWLNGAHTKFTTHMLFSFRNTLQSLPEEAHYRYSGYLYISTYFYILGI